MKIEVKKIIPEVQFYLSFGMQPSHPEAKRVVDETIGNLIWSAQDMEGYVEYMEERNAMYRRIFHLTNIARNCGFMENDENRS